MRFSVRPRGAGDFDLLRPVVAASFDSAALKVCALLLCPTGAPAGARGWGDDTGAAVAPADRTAAAIRRAAVGVPDPARRAELAGRWNDELDVCAVASGVRLCEKLTLPLCR